MTKLFENSEGDVTRLILVRHGRTFKNVESRFGIIDDTPLDHIGIQQSKLLAERLSDFPIRGLYTSPIPRAHQTADIIGEKIHKNPIICKELIEFNLGDIAGLTVPEVEKKYPDTFIEMKTWINNQPVNLSKRPIYSGAEDIENLESRVKDFVKMVLSDHPCECVCAITHQGFIKGFMATLFGRGVQQPMNFIAFNSSISIVDFEGDTPILMLFNDYYHLGIKLVYGKVTPF